MSYKTTHSLSIHRFFHVYNRGVNRGNIFLTRRQYDLFLALMKKHHAPEELSILAYCLMPNHYHFILHQKTQYAIARYVRNVCDAFVKTVNRAVGRSGHLFGGSYKIKLIDDQAYLTHLTRYIHRNPIHARIVQKAEDWRFSSYRTYLGTENAEFLSTGLVLGHFASREAYRRFVEEFSPPDREVIAHLLCGVM